MIVVHTYEIRPSMVTHESWNSGLEYVPRENRSLCDILDYFTGKPIDFNCGGSALYQYSTLPNLDYTACTGYGYGYLEYIFK